VLWLTRVPLALVRAHVEMLPRLQAEESLLTARRVAVGSGSMSSKDARSTQADWLRTIEPHTARARQKASPADLAAMGIGYHIVPAKAG